MHLYMYLCFGGFEVHVPERVLDLKVLLLVDYI